MDEHVETLIPVGIKRLLHDAGCMGLLCIHCDDREGVGQAEDVPLRKTIGGNDWTSKFSQCDQEVVYESLTSYHYLVIAPVTMNPQ